MTNWLDRARALSDTGLFADALNVLARGSFGRDTRVGADVLRAMLLERTGQYDDATASINGILRVASSNDVHRWACYLTLGRIAAANGDFDLAVGHLQRAITTALFHKNFEGAAWSQLRLLILLFDASGFEAVGPLVSQLRTNAARAADPRVLAALHLHVAEVESKRGLLASAERQIALALKILQASPNTWLLAMAEQNRANLSCLNLEFQAGIEHAERAVALSVKSGWAVGSATSAATLGNLFFFRGDFEQAAECSLQALESMTEGSDNFSGTLETLARIRLMQGRLDECGKILKRIDGYSLRTESIRRRFVYRHTLLTRARVHHHTGNVLEAASTLDEAIRLGIETRDDWLLSSARLAKAQLLADTHDPADLVAIFDTLTRQISLQPIDRHASLEHAFASGLAAIGEPDLAGQHVSRAKTIYQAFGHRLGLLELAMCPTLSRVRTPSAGVAPILEHDKNSPTSRTLQDITALINHCGRPKLIAGELLDLAVASGCAQSAYVVVRQANREDEILASYEFNGPHNDCVERRFLIGTDQAGKVELVLRPKPHIEAFASLKAISALLSALHELEHAREEREERATIWPADEIIVDGDSIIGGHMRETMALAQRVARTTVNVLITGESGTGKEIIARAIHNASARAQKPFVPFNCAAIPRDLVESQLFGHRRGAFTGADRDFPGVIRAARDGTLFFDEIGALSLDLQPKLLRFLESGEIAPLGDPATHHVHVRIVAATNTNLEEAVRDGRFREDLFYRLNVVRLSLKPLRERRDEIPALVSAFIARAAKEFNKGRLETAEETMERLLLYRWPGNVRQLQNELRRIVALAEPNSTLGPGLISSDILEAMPIFRHEAASRRELAVRLNDKLLPTLLKVECEMIKCALRDNDGKVDAVAKSLGISRKGLYLKRQRLGL